MDNIGFSGAGFKYWEDYYPYGSKTAPEALAAVPDTSGMPSPPTVAESGSEPPKILLLDIENSPNLAYVYDVWQTNVNADFLQETSEVISFAYKWLGSDDIFFLSTYNDTKVQMLTTAWRLLNEADVVVTYNGRKHDIPKLNTDFVKMGLNPPAPFKHIDLYETIKRRFNFTYNGLDHVCKQLGLAGKSSKMGFDTWIAALKGDFAAWEKIRVYNVADVQALDDLYYRIQPWIHPHPSYAAFTGEHVCPSCGSIKLQRRGYAYTAVSSFQRWHCQSCGAWSRTTKKESGVKIRQVADI